MARKKKNFPNVAKPTAKSAAEPLPRPTVSSAAKPVRNPSGRMVGEEHDLRRASELADFQFDVPSVRRGPASKAVSAFRLGYLSANTKYSIEVLVDGFVSSVYDVTDFVSSDVKRIEHSARALCGGSDGEPISGLRGCLDRYVHLHAELLACMRDVQSEHESRVRSAWAACLDAWRNLREECDRFLPEAYPMKALYRMGVELGEFERLASEKIGLGGEFPESGPDLRHLVMSAEAIPPALRRYSSALSDLAGMSPYLDQEPHPAPLVRFYEDHRAGWDLRWEITEDMAIVAMARDLVSRIDSDLEKLPDSSWEADSPVEFPRLPKPVKPIWFERAGELRVDGRLIRKFRVTAINQTEILKCFDEADWPESPESVANPFLARVDGSRSTSRAEIVDAKTKLSTTLDKLKDALGETITFSTRDDRVFWVWTADPPNS